MLNCNDTFDIKNKLRSYKGWPSVFVFFPVRTKILPAQKYENCSLKEIVTVKKQNNPQKVLLKKYICPQNFL